MTIISLFLAPVMLWVMAAELKPGTSMAFDHYVAETEKRIQEQEKTAGSFLYVDSLDPSNRNVARKRLRDGDLLIQRQPSPGDLPGAMMHHWTGTIFIPRATLTETLAVVQDYDHLDRYYSPEVMNSRLLSRLGGNFQVAMRLRKKKLKTIVLDTEYDVHYGSLDPLHYYSFSRSGRIAEIENPGESTEHALDPGHDSGFLWRLNTYWRFAQEEDGGGIFVECEALSLTRDVPVGLGWLIDPFIQEIPKESLQFTLQATRNAVLTRIFQRSSKGENDVSQPNYHK